MIEKPKRRIIAPYLAAVIATALTVYCANNERPGHEGGDNDTVRNDTLFLGNPPAAISEVALSNFDYADEFGKTPGWVEFFNPADTAVNLNGYFLTNSARNKRWAFGNAVVKPQGYTVVYMSGRDRPRRSPPADSIDLLTNAAGAWSWADYMNTPPGGSAAAERFAHGANFGGTITMADNTGGLGWSSAEVALKLYAWGDENSLDLSKSNQILLRGFVGKGLPLDIRLAHAGVNAWEGWGMTLTGTGAADELYAIDLPQNGGEYPNLKTISWIRFSTPSTFRGTVEFDFNSIIARRRESFPHASFGLSNGGGTLYLLDSAGYIRDSVAYPAVVRGLSYARDFVNGAWALSKPPTPGGMNAGEMFDGQVTPPSAGLPASGWYGGPLEFAIPQPTEEGAAVRCDTTGRPPTAKSGLVSGTPVSLTMPAVIRCAQFKPGTYGSATVMRTYIVGGDRPTIPIVSIAANPSELFDPQEGIYDTVPCPLAQKPCYGRNYWRETEVAAQIDFFESGAAHAWSHSAGLRIFGGYSRSNPKKSVMLTFRDRYGLKNLRYRMFPDHPNLTKFNHIVLRADGSCYGIDYIRDVLLTSLTGGFMTDDPNGLDIEYQKGRAAVVFYNGKYFGIHNIRERANSDYFETNFDMNEDFIDLVKGNNEASRGSDMDYQRDIVRYLETVSLEDDANLAELARRMDIDNYTNYIQCQVYYANTDWPGNNLKRWRGNSPPTRWRWFLYDTDYGFDYPWNERRDVNMLDFITAPDGPDWPNPPHATLLPRKLFENRGYRDAFVNRFSLLIATYFAPTRVEARIDALMAPIENEIPRDQSRWGFDSAQMSKQMGVMRNFGKNRPAKMRGDLERFFGISAPADFTIETSGGGDVFVHNLRVAGGSATFKAYASVPVIIKAVPAPGRTFEGWSDGVDDAERVEVIKKNTALTARFGGGAL